MFFAVAVTMIAFAANSVLSRIGIATYGMDPFVFALIRVASGAVVLTVFAIVSGAKPLQGLIGHWRGGLSLAAYMIGFSYAYLTLGAGVGALILFGALQILLFGWAVYQGIYVPVMRWCGAVVALAGLAILLWPAATIVVPLAGTVAMICATIGWAVYTVLGQGVRDPLAASAGNFLLCLPLVALPLLAGTSGENMAGGIIAAVVAGAVTSGLGYALWYRVLPKLPVTTAATAQLSVPVIAVIAGILLLEEAFTARMMIAGLLVLGGIAVSNVRWVPAGRN